MLAVTNIMIYIFTMWSALSKLRVSVLERAGVSPSCNFQVDLELSSGGIRSLSLRTSIDSSVPEPRSRRE